MKYIVKELGTIRAYNGLSDIKGALESMGSVVEDFGGALHDEATGVTITETDWLVVTDHTYEILTDWQFEEAYEIVTEH